MLKLQFISICYLTPAFFCEEIFFDFCHFFVKFVTFHYDVCMVRGLYMNPCRLLVFKILFYCLQLVSSDMSLTLQMYCWVPIEDIESRIELHVEADTCVLPK